MSSRDEILKRVRAGVGKDDFARRKAIAEAYMAAHKRGPQPMLGDELAKRFQAKAEYLASTVEQIEAMSDAPSAVARYLSGLELGMQAVATPDVGGLLWSAAGLQVEARAAVDADKTGISGCFCAIAETGTLMLLSGPETPCCAPNVAACHAPPILFPDHRAPATSSKLLSLGRTGHAECTWLW